MFLSAAGLFLAALMSGSNTFADVARKKALYKHSLVPVTFWCQVFAAVIFAIALVTRIVMGAGVVFRDSGDLFGIAGVHLPPAETYFVYLSIDVLLVSIANLLLFRALQVSPLSLCIPFMAFTPIFLIPTGFVILGELPPDVKLLGVLLVFIGSVLMHRRLFAVSWAAPVTALIKEPGCRYILAVALIFSLTNPIENKLVEITDVYTQACAFGIGLSVFFVVLTLAKRDSFQGALQGNMIWLPLAGALDAISLLLQYASYHYLDVVIAVSIKRAGIVLAVLFGWLFFKESGIRDKGIASSVMLAGMLIIYLPLSIWQGATMTGAVLAAAALALYVTRADTSSIDTDNTLLQAGKEEQ